MSDYLKSKNGLDKYKVNVDPINKYLDILADQERQKLEAMLDRELTSEEDAYENIVELQRFISYPHDDIPNAENKVNEKLFYIQEYLGQSILNKGISIYENEKFLEEIIKTISVEEILRRQQRILNNAKLMEQLSALRYDIPEKKGLTREIVLDLAVYSKMVRETRQREYDEQIKGKENGKELE